MDSEVLNLRAKTSTLGFLFRKLSGVGLMKSEATPVHRLSIGLVQGLPKVCRWTSSGFIHKEQCMQCLVVGAYSSMMLGSRYQCPADWVLASSNSDIHTACPLPPVIMESGFTF
ncbi:hypothetical protein PCH_Pc12g01970 [Penicillium rubens Wisconsin 54-1255]|jgi:hypothetical protein|uniref:Uncharacterized protein n=1 Tax=Penicillium rubens (strain ATCC 28089 / DSM 1075 / NRRL 1951 / Wisconsin 54-1255) TaxID=500485 RepID=B6GZE0_PENRW|nr:hypothetical protein PCH_Pc12g01970 [Penicillium rubens Wisconsin 54-1255]